MNLICALADATWTVEGSIFDRSCDKCGRRVQIAPTGQRVLREHPGARILCGLCFDILRLLEPVTLEDAGTPEEVWREHRSVKPNMRRYRN